MLNIMNEADLEYNLLLELGLSVDSSHYLMDQDYGTFVFFNGKHIKAKRNNIEPFVNKHEVYFDPIRNVKLMRNLFQYYINKIYNLDNRYFSVFFPIYNKNGPGALEIKNATECYRSGNYNNESLRYIDLIFKISGEEHVDLSNFDIVR